MNNNLIAYYAERAKEYEKIYEKPERQGDLSALNGFLQTMFSGKDVFEIACGTGYWTERIAKTANTIFATDVNQAVIDVARGKSYEKNNVCFDLANIYTYKGGPYKCLFGGFILSHIKLEELDGFIEHVHSFIEPGGYIMFIDNNYVEGSSGPIADTDGYGNTYQERVLENGNKFSIVKNFLSQRELNRLVSGKANNAKFLHLKHYWVLTYNRK